MEITEVRVRLLKQRQDKLQAYCSVTLDDAFVIRDIKVIKGSDGYFVAMPSRKITDRCPRCRSQNHLRALYCNECGTKINPERAPKDDRGRAKLHTDVAHPITSAYREILQQKILEGFEDVIQQSGEDIMNEANVAAAPVAEANVPAAPVTESEDEGMEEFTRYEEWVLGETEEVATNEGIPMKKEPPAREAPPIREERPVRQEAPPVVEESPVQEDPPAEEAPKPTSSFGEGIL